MFALLFSTVSSLLMLAPQTEAPLPPQENLKIAQSLPALGSKEALESQEAFRSWSEAAAARMEVPFTLDYTGRFQFVIDDPAEGRAIDGEFLAKGKAVHRSLREIQHQVHFEVREESEGEGEFEMEFLLDGEWLSIFMQSDKVDEMRDGLQVRIEQPVAEQAYLDYMSLGPEVLAELESDNAIEAEIAEKLMGPILDVTPKDLLSNMHPAGYWNAGTQFLTCRTVNFTEEAVDAFFTIDVQKGSIIHGICFTFFHLAVNAGDSEDEFFQMMKLVEEIVEKSIIQIQFDKLTGAPLFIAMDISFHAQELDVSDDFSFRIRVNYQGAISRPSDLESLVFTPQVVPENNMDLTGFVELGLAELKNMKAEAEAEEDMDF